ncbi:MAG: Two-component response regulator protein [Rhizobium sp.]|nr:Two-component response regulator protein [Rhizobium sp.]
MNMVDRRIAVLVVEDEALLRMGIVDELHDAGFEVYEASNAIEAIALLAANSRIELMFTDVDMPGGDDGLKLAAAVRDRWPPIKIIVTSGLRNVDIDSLPVESRFMPKPYNPDTVIRSIREMTEP